MAAIAALIIVAACSVTFLSYRYVTSPPGYCKAQQRYISDAEFVQASIEVVNKDRERVYELPPDGRKVKHKDYSSMYKDWDFDPKNPNCCAVRREQTQSALNRIFDWQEVEVLLNPRTHTHIMGAHVVPLRWDVCGNLIWGFGIYADSDHPITTRNVTEVDYGL